MIRFTNIHGLLQLLCSLQFRNDVLRQFEMYPSKKSKGKYRLLNIECPFIAFTGSFVAVYKIEPDKVHYLWNGKKITISIEQFIKSWSGIVLLAETMPDSIEPDYKEHPINILQMS